MTFYMWIVMLGIIFLTPLTLLKKENRKKEEIRKAIVTVTVALGMIIAVLVFGVNELFALIIGGFFDLIVFNKKTYTKKRLIIYGSIILAVGIAGYSVFRDNPDYVMNHLLENPQTTSLYVAENGVELIAYQSDIVRPLASTVKMLIAVEYAMQIDAGTLNKDSAVSLDDLNRYYIRNTDGAHEEWLKLMNSEGKVKNNEVTVHDVTKGMVTYSSNANTDYLMDLLSITAINERTKTLGLKQHEEVYPISSAILISKHINSASMDEEQLIKNLKDMPMEDYRTFAENLSKQMKEGTIKIEDETPDSSRDIQKVWSDRLIGASANDYGKLLAIISNDELPALAAETVRDLLEWPMQLNEANHDEFVHLGMKGGSTLFILNDALYAENHSGDKIEMVIFTDDLNFWQAMLIGHNMNSFESKLLESKDYREKVENELSES